MNLPHLQVMDQDELRSIVDANGGQKLLIEEADESVKEYFRLLRCPECGGDVEPVVDARRPFSPGRLTPNFLARCTGCGCEFGPDSNIISRRGTTQSP